jgi:hypothetical protein
MTTGPLVPEDVRMPLQHLAPERGNSGPAVVDRRHRDGGEDRQRRVGRARGSAGSAGLSDSCSSLSWRSAPRSACRYVGIVKNVYLLRNRLVLAVRQAAEPRGHRCAYRAAAAATRPMPTSMQDLARALRPAMEGEVAFDAATRGRYATDASIYQIVPAGVVFPRTDADVAATLAIAAEEGVPVVARGGGTSQNGQPIGAGSSSTSAGTCTGCSTTTRRRGACGCARAPCSSSSTRVFGATGCSFPSSRRRRAAAPSAA